MTEKPRDPEEETGPADTMNTASYEVPESSELAGLLDEVERQKASIDAKKTLKPDLWPTILGKLREDWTYDSNAIEVLARR